MNRTVFIGIWFLACFISSVQARGEQNEYYCIGFYNLENLFDTIHDAGKNDYEYLPAGVNKWNSSKYKNKLQNMAAVLNEMGCDVSPAGMAVVGVCEVENIRVLNDLVRHKKLAHRGWQVLHMESSDKRGVDCALLYNPKFFTPVESRLVPYVTENNTEYATRGFLVVSGNMAGERLHIIVNHWPSRNVKSPMRERAGTIVRHIKDSLLADNPCSKVIIMGDMNDNPHDKSIKMNLGAKREQSEVKTSADLYNPWWNIFCNKETGTLAYRGKWNLYDQIILSGAFLGKKCDGLKYARSEIFVRDYMLNEKGKNKGFPKRTHANRVWLNGYSDHLPVIVTLRKKTM